MNISLNKNNNKLRQEPSLFLENLKQSLYLFIYSGYLLDDAHPYCYSKFNNNFVFQRLDFVRYVRWFRDRLEESFLISKFSFDRRCWKK